MTAKADRNSALATAYQAGDDGAFLELIRENRGLIGRAIRRYRVPLEILGVELDDAHQEAAAALVVATRTWDASRGAPWALWAYYAVCGAILKNIVRRELKSRGGRYDPKTRAVTMPVAISLQDTATGHEGAQLLAEVVPGGTRPDEAVVDLDALADVVAAEIEARYRIPGNRRKAARDIWGPQEENQ